MLTSLHLHETSREVCIKARSPPASVAFIGQVTKHTTVKWPIASKASTYNLVSETVEQHDFGLLFY